MPKKIDWEPIKQAYISSDDSLSQVACQFSVSVRAVEKRSGLEGWKYLRSGISPRKKAYQYLAQEKLVCDVLSQNISSFARQLNLPPVISSQREFVLSNGKRVDLIASHSFGMVSLFEVKAAPNRSEADELFYRALSQLLCYFHAFTESCNHPVEKVHLVVVLNHDVDPFLLKAFDLLKCNAHFIKVAPFLVSEVIV